MKKEKKTSNLVTLFCRFMADIFPIYETQG